MRLDFGNGAITHFLKENLWPEALSALKIQTLETDVLR